MTQSESHNIQDQGQANDLVYKAKASVTWKPLSVSK